MSNVKNSLREVAQQKLREAEKAYFDYAAYLPLGYEREMAFEVYENIRNAARVYEVRHFV